MTAATHVAVLGVGVSAAAGADEVGALLDAVLRRAGVRPGAVWCAATAEGRRGEPAVRAAARVRGLPLVAYPVPVLAQVTVPNPSDVARLRAGTPSVAEAAALHAARALCGGPVRLAVPKRASGRATAALAIATAAVEPDTARASRHVSATRHEGVEAVKPWYFLPERHAPGDGDSEDCP
ncbi:cobalamin biosynthesis protein [Actinomadura rifamycini]|uniref:cobalamin biosynthesis protein n=1 Tax=Actinomadura rifamycini TaxID=31962 RepID=UPI0003FC7D2B|nr:cobalamin biosynthesis protein [Actinomadura rifamycini]